jgi:hypothetical protein
MSYSPLGLVVTGTPIASAWGNTVRDDIIDIGPAKVARVTLSGDQSLTSATTTTIAWTAETVDVQGWHDTVTNNGRVTVDRTGTYLVHAALKFASNATGRREIGIRHSAGTTLRAFKARTADSGFSHHMDVSTTVLMTAGDYVYVEAYQSSGGALAVVADDTTTFLEVVYLGPT